MREKILYEEKYKKWGAKLKKDSLPVLNNLNKGFKVTEAYIESRGVSERGGKEQEFIVMKIYLDNKKISGPA